MNDAPLPHSPQTPERFAKLEEAVAFTQHDLEELSRQVRDLHDSLARLTKRLDRMDARVEEMETGGGDGSEQ